jgi:Icc-related predicted phosphoesterase
MRIKLVSDLHLEFSDVHIKNEHEYDVLILSGDILIAQDLHDHPEAKYSHLEIQVLQHGQARAQRFRDFLKRCSFQFPHVVYVAGNHEFYHGYFHKSIQHLRDECARFHNVYFLERDVKVIDDVTFIGGTLWTDMNRNDPLTMHAIRDMMMDYKCIRDDNFGYSKLKPAETALRHKKTKEYIANVVAEQHDKKFVVVGHHSPSFQSSHPQYANETLMNGGYHSSLEEFIMDRPQIKLWTHGHTHHCYDYMIGDTRIVCNPRGYEGYEADSGWNPEIILEI